MYAIDSFVLYVEDIERSLAFYALITGSQPARLSPTFVAVEFGEGPRLELKQRAESVPPATVTGGGTELSIRVPDEAALRALYGEWKGLGVRILQEPTSMVFGTTFVGLDPDGHRLRVFAGG
ncbi:MAG TPA: VOC family protein [Rectinemataceae bacterium]|nr:VOC family protein [Rectinemataceae bacterium]